MVKIPFGYPIRTAKAVAGAEPPKVRLKRQLLGEPELHADPKRPGEADWKAKNNCGAKTSFLIGEADYDHRSPQSDHYVVYW